MLSLTFVKKNYSLNVAAVHQNAQKYIYIVIFFLFVDRVVLFFDYFSFRMLVCVCTFEHFNAGKTDFLLFYNYSKIVYNEKNIGNEPAHDNLQIDSFTNLLTFPPVLTTI